MTFRSLDSGGDWSFGQGKSSYATKEAAIVLNISTRLYSWLNDCFYRMDFGIDWRNLIGGKNPTSEQGILLQTRLMLAQSYGVTRINSVGASLNRGTRALSVRYSIDTVYTQGLSRSVTL